MSSAKHSLTYILLTLLICSLVLNFFLTIKHARKETKLPDLKLKAKTILSSSSPELIDHKPDDETDKPTPSNDTQNATTTRQGDESSSEAFDTPTFPSSSSSPPTSSLEKPKASPTPRFGNFLKPEVLQQEKKRRRIPPNESPITTLPTYIPMEVKKSGKSYTILNEYWIPKEQVFDMIVIMPTMARIDNSTNTALTYLNSTIFEYYQQLKVEPDPIVQGKKILFIIQAFVNEIEHEVFYQLKEMYSHVEEFAFFVPPFRFTDPYKDIPNINYRDSNNAYPGKLARQQSCDIAFLTDFVLRNFKFKYLMYTEDDFVPCKNFLKTTFETLDDIEWFYSEQNEERKEFDKGFCSLKFATGLGGFIVSPVSAEVFLKYIKENIQLEPIDILLIFAMYSREMASTFDTCVRRGLTSYVYRKSQLEHIGGYSNWFERNNESKFGNRLYTCGWSLEGGVLWDVGHANRFNPSHRKCPRSNQKLIPCV